MSLPRGSADRVCCRGDGPRVHAPGAIREDALFADPALARRIESAEASLSAEVGEATLGRAEGEAFVERVAGGAAVFAGPGSPVNKIIGVGFEDPPDAAWLGHIERRFAERGAGVQAEIAALADPAWHATLGGRGYVLVGFEHVLGLDLAGAAADIEGRPGGGGIVIAECAPGDARVWLETVAEGFQHPDDTPAQASGQEYAREAIARVFEDLASASGFRRYLAFVDGTVAGGASLREHAGVAQLCGAATLPGFRRLGVQSALLEARLRDARRTCDLAVVTTAPGSRSQRNAQRRGFSLLYARALHVLAPRP